MATAVCAARPGRWEYAVPDEIPAGSWLPRGRQWLTLASVAVLAFWAGVAWRPPAGASGPRPADEGAAYGSRARRRACPATAPAGSAPASRPAVRPWSVAGPAGEFEPAAALMLSCRELADQFPEVLTGVVSALAGRVPVICLFTDASDRQAAVQRLTEAGLDPAAVQFAAVSTDTMWLRDYGPVFVRYPDGKAGVVDSDYSPAECDGDVRWRDDLAPRLLGEMLGLPVAGLPLRLPGGNLLTNGEGLLVTTSAVLRENADRQYGADRIRRILARELGIHTWVCVDELDGERTGHVDMFATFLAPDVAVVARMDPAADPANAAALDTAATALAGLPTSRGPLRVFRVPMPTPEDGIWRSYANVVLANGTLLVPSFNDVPPHIEAEAMDLYRRLLPAWQVVAIPSEALATSDGLLHCICIQVPRFVEIEPLRHADNIPDPMDLLEEDLPPILTDPPDGPLDTPGRVEVEALLPRPAGQSPLPRPGLR